MWSETTRHYFIWALESASRIHTIPYKWNRQTNRVEMKTSKFQIFLWYLISAVETAFEIFVIYRLLSMHILDTGTIKDKISLNYTAIAYAIPVIFQFATYKRWQLYPIFVNSFLGACQQFQIKHFPEIPINNRVATQSLRTEMMNLFKALLKKIPFVGDSISSLQKHHAVEINQQEQAKSTEHKKSKQNEKPKIKNRCDPYVKYIFIFGRILTSLQTVSVFRRPRQPYLLSSLWGVNDPFPWTFRLPIALFHVFLVWSLCFKMQLYIFTTLSYVSPAVTILHELQLETGSKNKNGTKLPNSIRSKKIQLFPQNPSNMENTTKVIPPMDFLITYRALQIQQNMFKNIFCSIELPFTKMMLMCVSILCIYGGVKLDGLRAVVLGIAGMCAMVTLKIIYQSIADLRYLSGEVLKSWRGEGLNSKWFQKMLKGSKPIVTRVGVLYTVGKMIVLFIYSIIMDRAITLLLAF